MPPFIDNTILHSHIEIKPSKMPGLVIIVKKQLDLSWGIAG